VTDQRQSSRFTGLITLAVIVAIIIIQFVFSSPFTGPVIIIALIVFQTPLGKLRSAALLVTLGALSLLEHIGFSIVFALGLVRDPGSPYCWRGSGTAGGSLHFPDGKPSLCSLRDSGPGLWLAVSLSIPHRMALRPCRIISPYLCKE
jgi:hypothetical protein